MQIQFEVTEQDFLDFNTDHHLKIKAKKINRLKIFLSMMGFILLFLTIKAIKESAIPNVIFIASTVVCGAIFALITPLLNRYIFIPCMRPIINMGVKKMLKQGKGNLFLGLQHLELKDETIRGYSETLDSELKYGVVEGIFEAKNNYYIYIGAIQVYLIPKAAFTSDAEKEQFFGILKEKTSLEITPGS